MKIYWKWHNFFQIFIFFCRKINFFGPKIFSQICTPRPTLVPKIKLLYWKLPISAGPTYFGVTDLAPLWVGPVSKKLQIVRKLFIGIYRKFQVDMPNDKKSYPQKGLRGGGVISPPPGLNRVYRPSVSQCFLYLRCN